MKVHIFLFTFVKNIINLMKFMSEKFVDTKEQLLAQSFDRHMSVNANAGSGKTTVLQKRFVNLLLDAQLRIEPRELVAITFTRKAAAEIFAKIAKALEEVIQNPQISKTQHAKLIRIRERLNSAHVSTIHSFCSSIIRDFPVESGVPPNFADISEAEKMKITNDAITDTLTEYLTSNDDNTILLKTLISAFSRRNFENMIRKILFKRDILPRIQKFYDENTDDEINRMATMKFLEFLKKNFIDKIIELSEVFEALGGLALSNEKMAAINSIIDYFDELKSTLYVSESDKIDISELESLKITGIIENLNKEKILTKELTLYVSSFKNFTKEELIELNAKLWNLKELLTILSCLENIEQQSELINYSRFLLTLANQVNEIVEYRKQDAGGLDFDDMLIKAQNMLLNEEIRDKIGKRYRFLMVDEFQDTNEIQYNIIKSLVPRLSGNQNNNNINLFIVGDPKQSIYGFRNADVRVFKKATEDIKKCNHNLIESKLLLNEINTSNRDMPGENEMQSMGELGLTISFRHLPVITAFTNQVCGNIMSRKDSEYDVEYSNLICSKRIQELNDFEKKPGDSRQQTAGGNLSINLKNKLFGSVKFLISEKTDKGNKDEKKSEAELLAIYIKNLISGKNYKFSDIAVLSRAATKFSQLAEAFQRYNIPYVLHSGKGFYKAQEVIDMISILKFLHNPGDDLALSAALRSPYFGLSDAELIQISVASRKTIFEKLETLVNNSQNIDSLFLRANNILSKLLLYSTRLSISHLIAQIIELCGWYGSSSASPSRAQINANLMKLKQYAANFEKRGFKTLFDFVEEINLISKEEISESEAVFITDDNAVNIMTIHAAKGLEFPIVALFNSNSAVNGSDNFIVDETLGLTFKSPVYNQDLKVYEQTETPLFVLAKNKNQLKDKAEQKRLLYVALTRAKEHLAITADISSTKGKNSLFSLILQGLNFEQGFLTENEIRLSNDLQIYDSGNIETRKIEFNVEIIKELETSVSAIEFEKGERQFPEILMDEIKSERANEVFSASRIIKFRDDRESYFNRYVLGFDDAFIMGNQAVKDEFAINNSQYTIDEIGTMQIIKNKIISGAEEGTIIHYIMENISRWHLKGNLDKDVLNKLVDESAFLIHEELNGEMKNGILREISNIVSTKLIKNNIDDIIKSKHEAEYNIPIMKDFFNAKIDLLFEKDSVYEVWDWKSNLISTREEMFELAKHYEFQMKVYAYLVMLLKPEQGNYKARLLFTKIANQNESDEDWTCVFQWTKEELQSFKNELENYILQMKDV